MIFINYVYETLINIILVLLAEIILFFTLFQPMISENFNSEINSRVKITDYIDQDIINRYRPHLTEIKNYIKFKKPIEEDYIFYINKNTNFIIILIFISLLLGVLAIKLYSIYIKKKISFNVAYSLISISTLITLELIFIFTTTLKLKINIYDLLIKILTKSKNYIETLNL